MLNFDFLEKGVGIVSPTHLVYDFSRKTFVKLYSINVIRCSGPRILVSYFIYFKFTHVFFYLTFLSSIPDFGVSTAILDTIDISRRWCKLNFGLLRGHVKSCYLPERIDASRQYFYYFIQIFWNNWQEITWTTLLYNDMGLLLPFKRS